MDHNFERLREHIIPLSNANDFGVAKKEWKLVGIQIQEEFDNCPCGQPIKKLCYIENQLNRNKTYVGNICVNQFIGIETGNLFTGLKRIVKDQNANPNEDLIIYSFNLGYIYESEYHFLMQTKNKRKLSAKQLSWKQKINRRIIMQTTVQE